MKKILIIGSSGHAKAVIEVVERANACRIVGLLDDTRKKGERTLGYPILGAISDLSTVRARRSIDGLIVAVGHNFLRSRVVAAVTRAWPGVRYERAIHPGAHVARGVKIGEGSVIMAGAAVNRSSTIGRHCILHTHASLDHDSLMLDFSSLAPAAVTGGHCRIGTGAAIGIGATLTNSVRIGSHSVIGAGAATVDNIGALKVAIGVPAKVVRTRRKDDSYF